MHISRRAPLLSAASSIVCIWIMAALLQHSSARRGAAFGGRARDDFHEPPALVTRERPALLDDDGVALAAVVVLVVRHDLARAAHVLAVDRVRDAALDRHRNGLLHLAAHDLARKRALQLRLFGHRRPHFVSRRACSPSTVFTRAMFRRTLRIWSGFVSCPTACCTRRLNCSRRSFSSSSLSSAGLRLRRSLAWSTSAFAITSPAG